MSKDTVFYMCPICFRVFDTERECHKHRTLRCIPGKPGSEQRKPMIDQFGNMVSSAPRWYLEARGVIPTRTHMPNNSPVTHH